MCASPIGTPHLISDLGDVGECTPLERLPRQSGEYVEDFLQRMVDQYPSVLPVEEVDDRVQAPLVPLGREVSTRGGRIDNLFVSTNGYPVIVETKLYRNPEARREVIAQILEYATCVRDWSYENLQDVWRKGRKQDGQLWE